MDPTQWLTRGAAARCLGVHVSTIRRLEARGELVPHIEEESGLRYFTLWQVMQLRNRRTRSARERAADMRLAAFEFFRQGVDWRDVAIRLRYDPLRVHRLWHLYSLDNRTPDRQAPLPPKPEPPGTPETAHRNHATEQEKSNSVGGPGFVKAGAKSGDSHR
jgi:hypothetical protein